MALRSVFVLIACAGVLEGKLVRREAFSNESSCTTSLGVQEYVTDTCISMGSPGSMKYSCLADGNISMAIFSDAKCAIFAALANVTAASCTSGAKLSCVDAVVPATTTDTEVYEIGDSNESTCSTAGTLMATGGCKTMDGGSNGSMSFKCVGRAPYMEMCSDNACATMTLRMPQQPCDGSGTDFQKSACGTKSATAATVDVYKSSACTEPKMMRMYIEPNVCDQDGNSSTKWTMTGDTERLDYFTNKACTGAAAGSRGGRCGTCFLVEDGGIESIYYKFPCISGLTTNTTTTTIHSTTTLNQSALVSGVPRDVLAPAASFVVLLFVFSF